MQILFRKFLFSWAVSFGFYCIPSQAQKLVKDIFPGKGSSNPGELTDVNGLLYFVADDGVHGRELWKSDGTEKGTVLVKDFLPGDGDGFVKSLTHVNGKLFFAATNPQIVNYFGGGLTKLWTVYAAGSEPVQLKDGINNALESTRPINLTNVAGALYYTNTLALGGQTYWGVYRSDGTDSPGTKKIAQLGGTNGDSYISRPLQLTEMSGKLYYIHNGQLCNGNNIEKIKIVTGNEPDLKVQHMTKSGNRLFFTADTKGVRRLWASDGTSAGTLELKDGFENPLEAPNPINLTDVNGTLYYSSVVSKGGYTYWALFKSNGTDYPGTHCFATFVQPLSTDHPLSETNVPYPAAPSLFRRAGPGSFIQVNGTLYFVFAGYLWKSDGTATGTVRISNTLNPSSLLGLDGALYFVNSNNAIYKTSPSSNLATGVYKAVYGIKNLTQVKSTLYFTMTNTRYTGNELYKLQLFGRQLPKFPSQPVLK